MIGAKKMLSLAIALVAFAGTISLAGCFWDDSDDDTSAQEVTSPFLICVNRNPGGVGIDLDSGKAYNIDDYPGFDWDIRIKTIKGAQVTSSKALSLVGAPYIKLRESAVSAVKWSSAGSTSYDAITLSAYTTSGLSLTVGIAEIDMSTVDTVLAGELTESELSTAGVAIGNYYYNSAYSGFSKTGLKQKYATLVMGEAWKSAAANTSHTDDYIYIVRSSGGSYYKLMITDIGENSDIGQSGYIKVVWQKLE
jgi:hypothetical protein